MTSSVLSNSEGPSKDDWAKIQLLALDVDGVLTDGTIFVGPDGYELKQFSVLDGLGLVCVKKMGVLIAVISGRLSPATTSRVVELGVDHVIQGRKDKLIALTELAAKLNLPAETICYVGDDEIDVPAIKFAGIGVAVPNGVELVLQAADWVTAKKGGHGAVREVCDRILESRNESVLTLSS
jgi:3-deoxy-D-manno-octulosonate 8-phosphate phosphatase (KDO 8-P phosphatase)